MAHTLNVNTAAVARRAALDSDAVHTARIELAACFQLAAQHGLEEGVCNHFSAVVPGHDDLFFVNPYGFAFSEVTASRLLVCDFDGNVIEGDGSPEATAFYIHAQLHRAMPRVKAAFHTHMPNATALCLLEGPPLLWLGQTALKFYGRTAVDEHYNGLALDTSEGDRIAAAMGDADILFLKNHGVMVAGASIAEAWDDPAQRGPVVDRVWPQLRKIAIDYTVAEPAAAAGRLAVIPGYFDWDDVGDFASLAKLNSGGRKSDLAILGENARVLSDASSGIVVSQSKRVISLIGVRDIVVVDTPDALLVTTSENAQRVKAVVDALKLTGSTDVL